MRNIAQTKFFVLKVHERMNLDSSRAYQSRKPNVIMSIYR